MKSLKTFALVFAISFISMAAFSQAKTIKITKPVSPEDLAQVKAILDTFDPNSYNLTIVTTDNKKYVNKGKGLESVSQITGTSPKQGDDSGLSSISMGSKTSWKGVHKADLDKLTTILAKYQ